MTCLMQELCLHVFLIDFWSTRINGLVKFWINLSTQYNRQKHFLFNFFIADSHYFFHLEINTNCNNISEVVGQFGKEQHLVCKNNIFRLSQSNGKHQNESIIMLSIFGVSASFTQKSLTLFGGRCCCHCRNNSFVYVCMSDYCCYSRLCHKCLLQMVSEFVLNLSFTFFYCYILLASQYLCVALVQYNFLFFIVYYITHT